MILPTANASLIGTMRSQIISERNLLHALATATKSPAIPSHTLEQSSGGKARAQALLHDVIGTILSSRQGAALRSGVPAPAALRGGVAPARAFLEWYHAGLAVTLALTAAGIVVAMVALRRTARPAVPVTPVPAEQVMREPQEAAID